MFRRFLFLLATTIFLLTVGLAQAQDNPITITLGIPAGLDAIYKDTVLTRFHEQHPDIHVEVVTLDSSLTLLTDPATDPIQHFQDAAALANTADVLYVSRYNLSLEATRAGNILDLEPLLSISTTFNSDDFEPAVYDSFQWDGSTWAIPTIIDAMGLMYNPAEFDAAGAPYPQRDWTLQQLGDAARLLEGGLVVYDFSLPAALRAFSGANFYDLDTPRLATPELADLLTLWVKLESDGVISSQFPGPEETPFQLTSSYLIAGDAELAALPLTLEPFGFAVSAGTANPEAAFALVEYLSQSPEVTQAQFGGVPARISLRTESRFPEVDAYMNEAIANASPAPDVLLGNTVAAALNRVRAGEDALTALQTVEAGAINALAAADSQRDTTTVAVATLVPTPVVAADEIALNFGLVSSSPGTTDRAAWQRVIDNFVAQDPQIAAITLNVIEPTSPNWNDGIEVANDCFFWPYSAISQYNPSQILDLQPLIDADPNFSDDDVLAGVMSQLQRENGTWALPVSIYPTVLRYNAQMLADAGVTIPENGWTAGEFLDALNQLKTAFSGRPLFAPDITGNAYSMLMAGFGALPIDTRTNPPTYNFSVPTTVETIRQVLNAAKDGTILYSPLAAFRFTNYPTENPVAFYVDELMYGSTGYAFGDQANAYAMMTFPYGDEFTPVAYELSMLFISANTLNPEACYRFISTMARTPELFTGMPAYQSVLNAPETAASRGENAIATFQKFAEQLESPNLIVVDNPPFESLFLKFVFDRYVIDNADLDAGLAQAQQSVADFRACAEGIDTLHSGLDDRLLKCVDQVDPAVFDSLGIPRG